MSGQSSVGVSSSSNVTGTATCQVDGSGNEVHSCCHSRFALKHCWLLCGSPGVTRNPPSGQQGVAMAEAITTADGEAAPLGRSWLSSEVSVPGETSLEEISK